MARARKRAITHLEHERNNPQCRRSAHTPCPYGAVLLLTAHPASCIYISLYRAAIRWSEHRLYSENLTRRPHATHERHAKERRWRSSSGTPTKKRRTFASTGSISQLHRGYGMGWYSSGLTIGAIME